MNNEHVERVKKAVDELKKGKIVILVDDYDRENEGDFVCAGEFATPENINFMATHGRGLICLTITPSQVERLNLPQMQLGTTNGSKFQTPFTMSIEATEGVTTGISAHDRAVTIKTAINLKATPKDIVVPGHIFPLKAQEGGVLVRGGQTEGSVDLSKIAGLNPSGVICEICNEDGSMARMPELEVIAKKFNLLILSIEDIRVYRTIYEDYTIEDAHTSLYSTFGEDFKMYSYTHKFTGESCVAFTLGDIKPSSTPILSRIHSQCITGEVFGSLRCDCKQQLEHAINLIKQEGRGIMLYQFQEGRGIGIVEKLKAYQLQEEKGLDTFEANVKLGHPEDKREYSLQANILRKLGLTDIRLITNNVDKIDALAKYDINVARVETIQKTNVHNENYIKTKKEKGHHLL